VFLCMKSRKSSPSKASSCSKSGCTCYCHAPAKDVWSNAKCIGVLILLIVVYIGGLMWYASQPHVTPPGCEQERHLIP
jgi:hypothetical protein